MPFRDREDAGRRLAAALAAYAGRKSVVLALPRGGVPVAAQVAERLGAPLDLVLVRKIGLPFQPELAMGAVVDGTPPSIVRNSSVMAQAGVSEAEFQAVCRRELEEIARRRTCYLGGRRRAEVAGAVAILVDDGIATGATVRAALRAVRAQKPRELVLAVPVAPGETVEALRHEADRVLCLEQPWPFGAIGAFYDDFRQVTDEEVVALLQRFPPPAPR